MWFEKMLCGILEMVNARTFQPLAIVFRTTLKLTFVGISGALGTQGIHFLSNKYVLRNMLQSILRNGEC